MNAKIIAALVDRGIELWRDEKNRGFEYCNLFRDLGLLELSNYLKELDSCEFEKSVSSIINGYVSFIDPNKVRGESIRAEREHVMDSARMKRWREDLNIEYDKIDRKARKEVLDRIQETFHASLENYGGPVFRLNYNWKELCNVSMFLDFGKRSCSFSYRYNIRTSLYETSSPRSFNANLGICAETQCHISQSAFREVVLAIIQLTQADLEFICEKILPIVTDSDGAN